jgi:PTS system mannitol-specific IIC component
MIHGVRGGVLGATATMGVIVGADIPMILGAMIMGPLGGWLMKKVDEALEPRIPVGFEMLINNFDLAILGVILILIGNVLVGPFVSGVSALAGNLVDWLVSVRLLPLAAIFIEPAKILFLNNAINHGVLGPLGVAAVAEKGRALHFLLETNPGPGLGLLIAFYVAGKGLLKDSAPGSMIIHFLGGIHEIYFPYVLAHPIMILAMIAGGFAADLWFVISGAGLVATPSPGSIFAYLAVIPPGQHFQVLTGVLIGAVVSFCWAFIWAYDLSQRRKRKAQLAPASAVCRAWQTKDQFKFPSRRVSGLGWRGRRTLPDNIEGDKPNGTIYPLIPGKVDHLRL